MSAPRPEGAEPDGVGTPDQTGPRRRPLLVAAAVVSALLVVALAVWAGTRDTADPAAGPSPVSPSAGADPSRSPSAGPSPTAQTEGPSAEPTSPADPTTGPSTVPTGTPDPAPFAEDVAPAVPLDEPAEAEEGVVARVAEVTAVTGVAEGPGEVAGPSLRFVLVLENGTSEPLDLDTVVVNLYAGPDRLPANLLAGSGDGLFSGELAPGADAEGIYVFRVDPDLRDVVALTLSYAPGEPSLLFEGPAPRE